MIIQILSGMLRSFARIELQQSVDNAFHLATKVLLNLKTKLIVSDEKLHLIKGESKPNILKNWGASEFYILIRPKDKQSVIDIWFNDTDFSGPRVDIFITPFYKHICNLLSSSPKIILDVVTMTDKNIEKLANESISSGN